MSVKHCLGTRREVGGGCFKLGPGAAASVSLPRVSFMGWRRRNRGPKMVGAASGRVAPPVAALFTNTRVHRRK